MMAFLLGLEIRQGGRINSMFFFGSTQEIHHLINHSGQIIRKN